MIPALATTTSSCPSVGDPRRHRGGQRAAVADVGHLGDDPPVELLHQAGGLGQVGLGRHRVRDGLDLRAQVNRDDVRALLRQPYRVAAALAARGAGDQRYLALHASRHVAPCGRRAHHVQLGCLY